MSESPPSVPSIKYTTNITVMLMHNTSQLDQFIRFKIGIQLDLQVLN
jgi:hypothetical protein